MDLLPPSIPAIPLPQLYILPYNMRSLLRVGTSSEYVARVVAFGVICPLGILTNALSAVMLVKAKLLNSWTYGMVFHLTLTDLFFCCATLIFYLPGVILEEYPYTEMGCASGTFLVALPNRVTITFFLLSAVQRYMAIVHNRHDLACLSLKWQPVVVAGLWLLGAVMCTGLVVLGEAVVVNWVDNCLWSSQDGLTLTRTLGSLMVFLPLLAVLLLYGRILWEVKTKSMGSRGRKDTRTALVLFGLCVAFACSYIPQVIYFCIATAVADEVQLVMHLVTWYLTLGIAAVNPLLYGVLFKHIGQAYRASFAPRVKSNQVVSIASATTSP